MSDIEEKENPSCAEMLAELAELIGNGDVPCESVIVITMTEEGIGLGYSKMEHHEVLEALAMCCEIAMNLSEKDEGEVLH